jgi:hypothetical protein
LLTHWVVEKAVEVADGIPVRPLVCWQKVERQEIQEIQVTKELFADERIKDKDN